MHIANRVALVTGGGQGVGAAIARRLAESGLTVAVNDLYAERAEQVSSEIRADGLRALAAPADITDRAAIDEMVTAVRAQAGPVDVLVNNAGIPAGGVRLTPFVDSDPADWETTTRINLFGVMHCCQAVIPSMIRRGWGRLITISSDSGRTGEARMADYAASKAAGASLMRSLAKELGREGITANALALGTIVSPELAGSEAMAKHARRYPVGRLGTPDDVAAAVTWLASDAAGWTTGQTIPINGGHSTS